MSNPVSIVKSADRVLDLLELLNRRGRPMTHGEIVDALDVPKSSLTKLIKNLVDRQYVALALDGKSYELGPRLAELSSTRTPGQLITNLSGPILREITDTTGESSSLSLLRGDDIEAAAEVASPQMLLSHVKVGTLIPLFASSGGKAILAFLPAPQRDAYLKRVELRPLTPYTIRRVAELRRQLREIAETGIAISREEVTVGVISLAVPVLVGGDAFPIAALNVALPIIRFNDKVQQRCIEALNQGAQRLAKLI